jgi:RNA polymerase sigma-70 factor (ECF subfamily)
MNTHRLSHPANPDWDWASARLQCLRFARRLLDNEEDAQEAVQEALIRGWRKRDQCREDGGMAWMLGITRNEALRVVQGRRRHETTELDAAIEPATPFDTDSVISRVQIHRLMEGFPVEDRKLLALRYEEDLTHSAVAERTGIPEPTVRVRLHRLRRRLRTSLQESP